MTTEYVLENARLKVVNQAAVLPGRVLARPFLDLKAVVWIAADENQPDSVMRAGSADEIFEAARRNTLAAGWTCRTVNGILGESPDNLPLYAITNEESWNGAAAMLFPQEAFADLPEGEWYILPSSIHEVLAVPVETGSANRFRRLVKACNHVLGPGEYLSDSVYLWDGEKLTIAED